MCSLGSVSQRHFTQGKGCEFQQWGSYLYHILSGWKRPPLPPSATLNHPSHPLSPATPCEASSPGEFNLAQQTCIEFLLYTYALVK